MERRVCDRFEISGATVAYKKKGLLWFSKNFVETHCPVLEVSYGGVRFLNHELLNQNHEILVKITMTEEKPPMTLQGKVIWCDLHPGGSYRYQTGVQFNLYGKKNGQNDPKDLTRFKQLAGLNMSKTKQTKQAKDTWRKV